MGGVADVPDFPYGEFDDERAEGLLAAKGVAISERQLIDTLRTGKPMVRAAAAHVLGAKRMTGGILELLKVGRNEGDLLRAEVGFALARMDIEEGVEMLRTCVDSPAAASAGAATAAGFLAREGDSHGVAVVKQALADSDPAIRVVGTEQLWWFVPFDDVDVWELFAVAVADEWPDVRTAAAVQLRQIDHPRAVELLKAAGG